MVTVIIKNELKLELYRDFIKSNATLISALASSSDFNAKDFARDVPCWVNEIYDTLIKEGVIEEQEVSALSSDDVEKYINKLNEEIQHDKEKLDDAWDELEKQKKDFWERHRTQMEALDEEMKKLTKR